MTKEIGIGVVGCGAMGRGVVTRVLEQDGRIKVRALFDPDQRSIDAARKEYGADLPADTDYAKFLARPEIDWVMIASWNCYHCEQTVAAFNAGKHVFCQKPLATNFEDCLAMEQAWKKSGKNFVIGFTLRFSPHYRKLKELLDAGTVGRIVSFEFNETLGFNHGGYIMGDWRRLTKYAGTHLLEKCSHDIDLANWFINSLPVRVAGFGGLDFFKSENVKHAERIGKDPNGKPAYQTWGGLVDMNPFTSDKDILDNLGAILEYANGVRAMFHTNCNAAIPERRMYILGTEGAIRANVLTGDIEIQRIGFDTQIEKVPACASGGHGGGDEILAKEVADTMLKGAPPTVSLDAGLSSAIVCFAVDEATEKGTVVDVRPMWKKAGLM